MDKVQFNLLNKLLLFSLTSLVIAGCSSYGSYFEDESNFTNNYYYPYLSQSEVESLSYYNVISVVPSDIIVPNRFASSVAPRLNANNLVQSDTRQTLSLINHFIANQAQQIVGCAKVKQATDFVVQPGVYHFKHRDISIAAPLHWQLKHNIASLCKPSTIPHQIFLTDNSKYWDFDFSQKEVFK